MVTNITSSLVVHLTATSCVCVCVALKTWSLHCIQDNMNVEVSCAACTELSKTAMKLHYCCKIGN